MNSEEAERKRKLVEDESDFVALSLIRGYRPKQQPLRELPPFQRMFSSQPQQRLSLFLSEPLQQLPPPSPPFQLALFVPVPPQLPMINPQPQQDDHTPAINPSSTCSVRSRRAARKGKSETIPILFQWATDRRATVYSLQYLLQNQFFIVTRAVVRKRYEQQYETVFDLKEKFAQVWSFLAENKSTMHNRALSIWTNPVLPTYEQCG